MVEHGAIHRELAAAAATTHVSYYDSILTNMTLAAAVIQVKYKIRYEYCATFLAASISSSDFDLVSSSCRLSSSAASARFAFHLSTRLP